MTAEPLAPQAIDLQRVELLHVIKGAIDAHPRSQQVKIGPSEIGTPCLRKLGHKLAGTPEVNTSQDGWKATVGTAIHTWLAETFALANRDPNAALQQLAGADGLPDLTGFDSTAARYLVEQRVTAGSVNGVPLDGSCDLLDRATGTVVDWKCTSLANIKKYRVNGPGDQYRVQAHTYGLGYANRGEQVLTVAVMFLPRDAELRQAYLWAEPYDPSVAQAAMQRASGVAAGLAAVGAAAFLPHLAMTPTYCNWCPYHMPGVTDAATACPGTPARPERASGLAGLITKEGTP